MTNTRRLVRIDLVPGERPHFEVRFLRRLRAERRVATYVIGGRIFFDLEELDAYAENQRTEAVAP